MFPTTYTRADIPAMDKVENVLTTHRFIQLMSEMRTKVSPTFLNVHSNMASSTSKRLQSKISFRMHQGYDENAVYFDCTRNPREVLDHADGLKSPDSHMGDGGCDTSLF
jgi:hypothetical protein